MHSPNAAAAAATIRASDLSLVLASVKLRAYTRGQTCRLAALSERPVIELTCRDRGLSRAAAAKYGMSRARVLPLERGDIGALIERVQREHGRREVLRTWGCGVKALLAEDRYVLDGGAAA